MSVALAFLRRDGLIWSSYRLAMLWQGLGLFLIISLVYLLGSAVGDSPLLASGRQESFVAFILSGIALTDAVMQALYAVPQAIRENQKSGTLESMLLTPISPIGLALSSGLFSLVLALGRMTIILSFGALALGYWRGANLLTLLVVLLPAGLTFLALGIFSAAFIVLVKQGDPVLIAYAGVSALLSGVFFPVQSLPGWLQPLTALVPLSHALTGLRAALAGAPPEQVAGSALLLAAMALLLLPPGVIVFHWAVGRAKKEGSLGQY